MLRLDWKAHHVPRAQGCGAGTEAERAELCRLLRRRGVGQDGGSQRAGAAADIEPTQASRHAEPRHEARRHEAAPAPDVALVRITSLPAIVRR